MLKFCTSCGAQLSDGVKFCNGCGASIETQADAPVQTVQQAPPQVQPKPASAKPPAQTIAPPIHAAKPPNAFKYWGWIFIMLLPLIGLIVSFMWSAKKVRSERRSLARAMIFFSLVSIAVCVVTGISLYICTQVVGDIGFSILGFKIF
jgi:hypothetical protein